MNIHTPASSPSGLRRKFVVIGGTGLVGKPLVARLRALGHEVVVASPSRGVNAVTGEGLAAALSGADTVIDVANSPSFENRAVLEFFENSSRNLLAVGAAAGVRHHVALSVVGVDRLPDSGYFLAKLAQERLVQASPVPYTIVRATQFFEFAQSIAHAATEGETVRVPPARMQPVAAADVSAALADVALAAPRNGIVELAGPEPVAQDVFVRRALVAAGDARTVVADPAAGYFGAMIDDRSLAPTPGALPLLGATRHESWLAASVAKK
jgi:uncharacterized protein YbjT (DUF2867 family)